MIKPLGGIEFVWYGEVEDKKDSYIDNNGGKVKNRYGNIQSETTVVPGDWKLISRENRSSWLNCSAKLCLLKRMEEREEKN